MCRANLVFVVALKSGVQFVYCSMVHFVVSSQPDLINHEPHTKIRGTIRIFCQRKQYTIEHGNKVA